MTNPQEDAPPHIPSLANGGSDPSSKEEDQGPIVVGIGSSAGGLEATKELIAALGDRPGAAVVIVPHMDPSHESHLQQILQRVTSMPVSEIKDGLKVVPDQVYVIPPGAALVIDDGMLRLRKREDTMGSFVHVVDRFFRSLAEDKGSHAMGVVLSGTLTDGTQGLREIKMAGGITFAQALETAGFKEMPRNAITGSNPDVVGSCNEIAEAILDVCARLAAKQSPLPAGPRSHVDEDGKDDLEDILKVLRHRTGVDFTQYKRTTLSRRIQRRMYATGKPTLESYTGLLVASDKEAKALQEEILIHVTRFFRDPEVYDMIKQIVLPAMVKDPDEDRPLRIWVPGCATGEEAYSIAITVTEYLEKNRFAHPIQIFATDLSEAAVQTAREGLYPDTILEDVSEERLLRFFEQEGSGYRIRKHVRGLCVFATHNILVDPPFSGMDLVSLRNVLVYMEAPLQRRVLSTIHYSLKPGRFLVLGPSESVGRSKDLFDPHPQARHVFARRDVTTSPIYEFSPHDRFPRPSPSTPRHISRSVEDQIHREMDRILIERYAPPGVAVDRNLQVVHFRGRAASYLEYPSGPPTFDLMRMAPEALAVEIRALVEQVRQEGVQTQRKGVRFESQGRPVRLNLEATPLLGSDPDQTYYLVTFHDASRSRSARSAPARDGNLKGFLERRGTPGRKRMERLERELAAAREHLRFMTEDHEATVEELRSANEEALSANEELQSMNEELETTKEELQSANEELRTLNEELHQRSHELETVNNDLVNLINSVGSPVVMLGPGLKIRRFTPKAKEFFNLIATDIGRPFTDMKPPFHAPDLGKIALEVLEHYRAKEVDVEDHNGTAWRLQFHPYRTTDHKVNGVVMIAIKSSSVGLDNSTTS